VDYADLKARVLAFSFRPDLTAEVAQFIALTEGKIKRELTAMPLSVTLLEADRSADGVYELPDGLTQVRAVYATDSTSEFAVAQVSLQEVKRLPASAPVRYFCVLGDTIEFRGVPATGAEFTVQYLGHPAALVNDSDENDLLTNHEALYVYGALFHLYQYTQDLELSQSALDTYTDALTQLNEQAGRKLGGARVANAYTFGPITRGY
jgi:hypothetical protein